MPACPEAVAAFLSMRTGEGDRATLCGVCTVQAGRSLVARLDACWTSERFAAKEAVAARVECNVGEGQLHPGSITLIVRRRVR